ncbi:MAG: type II toxin-antitoxin system RelE/ParE family toxin [Thermodesulfobacteriota bacterium]
MKYCFHPEALEEYMGAISRYAEVNPSLARSSIRAVESGIEQILRYPQARQIVEHDVRRRVIKRFPFGIYYCAEGELVTIYAVMHMSRHPDYWRSRIEHK